MTPRSLVRLALLVALGAGAAVSPLTRATARAQQPVPSEQPVVDLILPAAAVADGRTALTMHVVAYGLDGAPITGLKGKPSVTSGSATELTEAGPGVYRFQWTPDRYAAPGSATVTLKAKNGQKVAVEKKWTLRLSPPAPTALKLAASPARLTMGVDPTGAVSVSVEGIAGRNPEVLLRASSGKVENVTAMGPGSYTASLLPPAVAANATPKPPHLAIITAVDRRDPASVVGAVAVPMVSRINYPFSGLTPGAAAIVKLGGREYPPVVVDGSGRATVTVDVAPGAGVATITQVLPDGSRRDTPYDLRVPDSARWSLFPLPAGIPADGRTKVPVRAFVATPDGRPDTAAAVKFDATAGTFDPVRHEGNGVYVANYTPPAANATTEATISVALAAQPSFQPDAATVRLLPTRAGKLTMTAEPTTLAATATGFKVYAKASSGDLGLGGRQLNFSASGATVKESKDLKNGDYSATFVTQTPGAVEIAANLSTPESGNPVAHVLVLPAQARASTDAPGALLVHVVTVDASGYSVPNQPVNLRVVSGEGTIPATLTTDADGVVTTSLTTGRTPGVVSIEAVAADAVGHGNVLQLPGAAPAGQALPFSGDDKITTLAQDWAGGLGYLRVPREGAAGISAGPLVSSETSTGAAARIVGAVEPGSAVPGGFVNLKVQLTDSAGKGVTGKSFDVIPSVGTVSAFKDVGGGSYVAQLTLPPSAALGEAKIAIATTDGAMTTVVKVPIVTAAGNAWAAPGGFQAPVASGPTTAASGAGAPVVGTPPLIATTPAPAAGSPGLGLSAQVSLAYGAYGFQQTPLATESVLFPSNLRIDATAPGFDARVAYTVPGLAWLGVEAGYGTTRYTLDPQPLCAKLDRPCASAEPVPDWITDLRAGLTGRYALPNGAWVLGRAGWSRSDMQAYKLLDAVIGLDQLSVNALTLGASVGGAVGDVLLEAGASEHLAGGTTPWNTEVGASVGYRLPQRTHVTLGYRGNFRAIDVSDANAAPIGDLTDALHTLRFGFGFEL